MVFKRRKQLHWTRRASEFVYPRRGWRRALEYIGHRLKRLPDTPHKIAIGVACGAMASFSPLFGFHFIYAAMLAVLVRGNVLAACIGTFVGNPLTFPFIATLCLSTGRRFFGDPANPLKFAEVKDAFLGAFSGLWQTFTSFFGYGHPAWDKLGVFWSELFVPYFVGGIVPGLIAGVGCYFLTKPLVAAYQARRKGRLLARAKERLARKKRAAAGGGA